MPKGEIIKELEKWVEENRPGEEIVYGGFESKHASGQENFAIYDASDDYVIQENDINNPNSEKHREFTYKVHE